MLQAHKPIQDPLIVETLFKTLKEITAHDVDIDTWDAKIHCNEFYNWIQNQDTVSILGLDEFSNRALCAGTSAAIENFISRNHQRRLRFSQTEFVLSKIVCRNLDIPFEYLEDSELQSGDALVLSLPFSGNGSTYPNTDQILTKCTELGIPVLIDAAYIGIANFITIDLRHKCITDFTTSLSKPFHTMLRHGIRFTRNYYDDNIQSSSDMGIVPRINVVLANRLMKIFDKDYIIKMYANKNSQVCRELGLAPTNTITLALGNYEQHAKFIRGNYVRVCITDELMS